MKVKTSESVSFMDPYGEQKQKLINKGYTSALVNIYSQPSWARIHNWCKEYTQAHYTWFGFEFWFATQQDATLFALKWS